MLTLDHNAFESRVATGSKRLFNPSVPSNRNQSVKSPHCNTNYELHTKSLSLPRSENQNSAESGYKKKHEPDTKRTPKERRTAGQHPDITMYLTAGSSPSHDKIVGSQHPCLLLQPDTHPISHEELVAEGNGIYAGLIMVEAKCIDVDKQQSAVTQGIEPVRRTILGTEQWQALIALHRTLLYEHYDLPLASQHPLASPALTRLVSKYSMPARKWQHGIHAFLEVLRHRLPESLDHMLAFVYIAYSMMALLYETVPSFEDTWIECLGDLERYQMAIEDDDVRDRGTWSGVARLWCSKAAQKAPNVGRLYHHLAILARPNKIQPPALYMRSLTCLQPFETARESILTLFKPICLTRSMPNLEDNLICLHAVHFTANLTDEYDDAALAQIVIALNTLNTTIEPRGGLHAGRPLPEDFVMRGQIWSTWYFPDRWFDNADIDNEERMLESPSMDRLRLDWILWLGRCALNSNARLSYDRIGQLFRSRMSKAARYFNVGRYSSYFALRALAWSASIQYAFAAAIPQKPIDANNDREWPIGSALPSLSSWPYVGIGTLVLAITYILARRSYAPRVWGIMMAIFAFVWLVVQADATTTGVVRWTTFTQGAFSTTCFATTQFRTYRMSQGYALLTCITALVMDYFIARAIQPDLKAVSTDDLVMFLLPSFGVSLLFTTYCGSLSHTPNKKDRG